MADVVILEFEGVTSEHYDQVNGVLGIDPETGDGDWPDGLVSHVGAARDGGLLVVEVWESQAAQGAFMESRLGPALGEVGLPAPTRAEWFELLAHNTP